MENNSERKIHIAKHNSCGLCCVKINNISVKIDNRIILDDINIHMHCGEITCIIGPNGAGKSTLLKSILGMMKHTGSISYLNKNDDITSKPIIGYVPQKISLEKNIPISVKDVLNIAKIDVNNNVYKKVIDILKISDLLNKKMGELSGGEVQKVLIALAMNPFPDILLFDEPIANIDRIGITQVYKIISTLRENFDIAIIVVSHDLESMYNYADNVILMNKKVLKQGSPKEVYDSEEFKKIFEVGDINV